MRHRGPAGADASLTELGEAASGFVGGERNELEVGVKRGFEVNFTAFALPFPKFEDGVEAGGIGTGPGGDGGDGFVFGMGLRLAASQHSVAEERTETAHRGQHEIEMRLWLFRRGEKRPAEIEAFAVEFALDLQAMEVQRRLEIFEPIGTEENAVMALNVKEFNRENMAGAAELVKGEEERHTMALFFGPPVDRGMELREICGAGAFEQTENVQVGMLGGKFSGDGRAEEDDGLEIVSSGDFQAIYELLELGFHFRPSAGAIKKQ